MNAGHRSTGSGIRTNLFPTLYKNWYSSCKHNIKRNSKRHIKLIKIFIVGFWKYWFLSNSSSAVAKTIIRDPDKCLKTLLFCLLLFTALDTFKIPWLAINRYHGNVNSDFTFKQTIHPMLALLRDLSKETYRQKQNAKR